MKLEWSIERIETEIDILKFQYALITSTVGTRIHSSMLLKSTVEPLRRVLPDLIRIFQIIVFLIKFTYVFTYIELRYSLWVLLATCFFFYLIQYTFPEKLLRHVEHVRTPARKWMRMPFLFHELIFFFFWVLRYLGQSIIKWV